MKLLHILRKTASRLESNALFAGPIRALRGRLFAQRTALTDRKARPIIDALIRDWLASPPRQGPSHIEIETLNRCNGGCSFCPVNRYADPRPQQRMSDALFASIIEQLGRMDYDGVLSLYSNNEPLLDRRSYEFHEIARRGVPHATIMLVTNGTPLDVAKFRRLMASVDILRIDNYSDRLELHDNIRAIRDDWQAHPLPGKEVSIVVRRENEIRTTRGGAAPNRGEIRTLASSCLLPFMQMVIRPDGKLSLCCNDALGENTLGDLNHASILEIWNGAEYRAIRERIQRGRARIPTCAGCDTFLGPEHAALAALPAYTALRRPRVRAADEASG